LLDNNDATQNLVTRKFHLKEENYKIIKSSIIDKIDKGNFDFTKKEKEIQEFILKQLNMKDLFPEHLSIKQLSSILKKVYINIQRRTNTPYPILLEDRINLFGNIPTKSLLPLQGVSNGLLIRIWFCIEDQEIHIAYPIVKEK
jgi:hypothetical protein